MDTLLHGWSLQHLLEVGVVQSTFCPKGDLSLHLLRAQTKIHLLQAVPFFYNTDHTYPGKT